MNPLLSRSRQSQGAPDLRRFLATQSPASAQQRMQDALRRGQITQGQMSQLIDEARAIGRALGLR